MEKVSTTFLRFAKPFWDPETSDLSPESPEVESLLRTCALVWNAVVAADNSGNDSWLQQLEDVVRQESHFSALLHDLISWKRIQFAAYPWLIGDYGFRYDEDGELRFYANAHASKAIEQAGVPIVPNRDSDSGLAIVLLSFAEPMMEAFGNPSPRSNEFDAALTLSHVVWNAATVDQRSGSRERVQHLLDDNKAYPEIVSLIRMLDERKRAQFSNFSKLLGSYDYDLKPAGDISLWVHTHEAESYS